MRPGWIIAAAGILKMVAIPAPAQQSSVRSCGALLSKRGYLFSYPQSIAGKKEERKESEGMTKERDRIMRSVGGAPPLPPHSHPPYCSPSKM